MLDPKIGALTFLEDIDETDMARVIEAESPDISIRSREGGLLRPEVTACVEVDKENVSMTEVVELLFRIPIALS